MRPGEVIATVHAEDADSDRYAAISYFIPKASNTASARKLVKVDPDTGVVTLQRLLDREQFDG